MFICRWGGGGVGTCVAGPRLVRPTHQQRQRKRVRVTRARFELFAAMGNGMEWRFVATNNHVIAIGGDARTDVASAPATLAAVQAALPEASWAWYQDPAGRWRWDFRWVAWRFLSLALQAMAASTARFTAVLTIVTL